MKKQELMSGTIMIDESVESDVNWQQNSPGENIIEKSIQEGSDTLSSNSNSFVVDSSNMRANMEKEDSRESTVLRPLTNESSDLQISFERNQTSYDRHSDDDSGFETIVGKKTDYGDVLTV